MKEEEVILHEESPDFIPVLNSSLNNAIQPIQELSCVSSACQLCVLLSVPLPVRAGLVIKAARFSQFKLALTIGAVSFLVASLLRLKRVYFGGSYIRGHASTMDNISYAIDFWSKGQMHAIFLRHEGFLGALGALLSNLNLKNDDMIFEDSKESVSKKNTTSI
ncbi:Pantothenate kinase 2 [Dendrobium catenatum]|uniref:Pantothenate kinase 2 n=1 Tax=Dendrobium catenatum TaxID=906689 RepID=A0A2I0WCB5_9ASPA|nr:Pantothenate kinase 2 [Dendrobium catenatum]